MSCILRISGNNLDIDALLLASPIAADRSWTKGKLRGKNSERLHSDSGANFLVSNADLDASHQQLVEATEFLERHLDSVAALASFPGVEQATLDFGIGLREGSVAVFFRLPPALVSLAAQANIGLEVSSYLCSEESIDTESQR